MNKNGSDGSLASAIYLSLSVDLAWYIKQEYIKIEIIKKNQLKIVAHAAGRKAAKRHRAIEYC